MAEPTRILLVEDDAADAYILRWHLLKNPRNRHRFELEHVEYLEAGLERLSRDSFAILLLDLGLPDSVGIDTFCRAGREATDVPIIVLSGLDDEDVALSAVREGAQDYLVKSEITGPLLIRSIRYAIERHHLQRSLRDLSLEDELTGLYNRRGFQALAEQQIRQVRRSQGQLTLVYLDLDGLKTINDSQGHRAGDEALVETADILRRSFRDADIVARLGGDEFAVLLLDTRQDGVEIPIARFRENLARANRTTERGFPISVSFGFAAWDDKELTNLDELIARADEEMYLEKRKRKAGPDAAEQP